MEKDRKLDKVKIANWAGWAGGGVFCFLNLLTKGTVPGGAIGGVIGYIIGSGLTYLVLTLVTPK